jgi:hypothetical protein
MGKETEIDGLAEVIRKGDSPPLHGETRNDSGAAPHPTVERGRFTRQYGFLLFCFCSCFGKRRSRRNTSEPMK